MHKVFSVKFSNIYYAVIIIILLFMIWIIFILVNVLLFQEVFCFEIC